MEILRHHMIELVEYYRANKELPPAAMAEQYVENQLTDKYKEEHKNLGSKSIAKGIEHAFRAIEKKEPITVYYDNIPLGYINEPICNACCRNPISGNGKCERTTRSSAEKSAGFVLDHPYFPQGEIPPRHYSQILK